MGRIRRCFLVGVASAAALALPVSSSAAAAPVAIGTSESNLAGVAVDPSGTAYIAWEDSSASNAFLHYCKLPAGATTCSVTYSSPGQPGGMNAPQGPGGAGLLGTPSVILLGNHVMVFAFDNGGAAGTSEGVAGWVSNDGGNTFTLEPPGTTMSYTPPFNDGVTTNPVSELGNGLVGVGYVVPQGSPQFQAVQYDPSAGVFEPISQRDYIGKNGPPYARLDPTNRYAAGNLGGEFAAQPTGASAGVLAAITAFPNASQNPCPDGYPFVSWAFAPLSAATTQNALNTDPGAPGSAWTQALTLLECNSENPAVAGGPGGFGVLDGSYLGAARTSYHRFDGATGKFDLPAATLAPEAETSPALSQDGAGGIYASWITGGTELRLAYSADGGASWNGPVTLTASPLGDAASAVSASGAGIAAYHAGGTEYALPFTKADTIRPPEVSRSGVSNGRTVSLTVSCQSTPCTVTITITGTQVTVSGRASDARKHKHRRTIVVAKGTFRLRKKGPNKVAVRLTGAGKRLIAKDHGHLRATIAAGVRVAGTTVKSRPHGFSIRTVKGKKRH